MMNAFGERLRKLRKERNIRQVELAELLEIKQSTISQYENDEILPSTGTLIRLAIILGVSTDYLMTGRMDAGGADIEFPQGLRDLLDDKDLCHSLDIQANEVTQLAGIRFGDKKPTKEGYLHLLMTLRNIAK